MKTPEQPTSHPYREAFRADVQTLYATACCCEHPQIPALTALAARAAVLEESGERFDEVRWAIGQLGGGPRSEAAAGLMGLDDTRGWTQRARWDKVALMLDYKTGDSFRHGQERGRNIIDVILDEITSGLVELAERYEFSYDATDKTLLELDPAAFQAYFEGVFASSFLSLMDR